MTWFEFVLISYNVIRDIDHSMANEGNARGFQSKGKSSDVELPVFPESVRDMEEQFSNLDAVDVTPDKLKTKQPLMSPSNLESRTGFAFHPAASVTQNLGSNLGLGFRSTSQNTFHPNSAVQRLAITPISSPVFAGFTQNASSRDGKRRDLEESNARYEGDLEAVLNLEEEDVMHNLKVAEQFYLGEYPDETESRGVFGTKAEISSGLTITPLLRTFSHHRNTRNNLQE
jgi:hypothetical protein